MKRITLEGGIKLAIFDLPPENFDPLTATPAELEKYGLPAMPDDRHHRERYRKVFSQLKHKLKFVEPEFRVIPRKSPAPGPSAGGGGAATGTSSNWSGSVVYPPQGESFKWVQAEWVVPNVVAPGNYCLSWVGMDGDSTSDLLLAGVQSTVGGSPLFVWWWTAAGFPELEVPSLKVSTGDRVSVILCSNQGAGSTTSTVYFVNLTTGQSTYFTVGLELPQPLFGNSAEWIVSGDPNPRGAVLSGTTNPLADYGEVFFTSCEAVTALGNTTVSGGTGAGNAIDIITNGGVISQGILIDATTVECLYGPPPSPPQPVDCKSLLENIYVHIGEGRHLPVPEQELSLWERELLACYSAGKISEYEYTSTLNLIHSHQK